jgi:hypothetical protein
MGVASCINVLPSRRSASGSDVDSSRSWSSASPSPRRPGPAAPAAQAGRLAPPPRWRAGPAPTRPAAAGCRRAGRIRSAGESRRPTDNPRRKATSSARAWVLAMAVATSCLACSPDYSRSFFRWQNARTGSGAVTRECSDCYGGWRGARASGRLRQPPSPGTGATSTASSTEPGKVQVGKLEPPSWTPSTSACAQGGRAGRPLAPS